MSLNRTLGLAALGLVCLVGTNVRAVPVTWTIDSTASVISMAIPNFTYQGTPISIAGQNRTNGAPLSSSWSTTTGNSAFIAGTIATDWANNGTTIQFLSGMSNIAALTSGNYRPNPAAYNSVSAAYNNNSAAAADYGATVKGLGGLISAAEISLNHVTYDVGSGVLPISSNVFAASNTSMSGVADFYLQGISTLVPLPNTAAPGTFIPSQGNNVNLGVIISPDPIGDPTLRKLSLPVNITLDFSSLGVPGATATFQGTIVASAHVVPEPSSLVLVGTAGLALVAVARRRIRWRHNDPASG